MFVTLDGIQGHKGSIEFDDDLDMSRIHQFANGKKPTAELILQDGRKISPEQRKKTFALLHDISQFTGYDMRDMEQEMKYRYYAQTGAEQFSLSDCDMTTANKFLTFMLDLCFEFDIPFRTKTWDAIPVDYHLAVQCLRYRKCVICGQHADVHHWFAVGNRSRKLVDHRKMYFMALCRKHHELVHSMGSLDFMDKFHIKPVKLSDDDLINLHIMTRKRMNEIDEKQGD